MEFFTHHNTEAAACLPPGFRFHPTDEELITCYLLKKVLDGNFTGLAFADVDLNRCEPWDLPRKAKMGGKEWYFFSLRDRKYPTGLRTNRATEGGYWKATGKDREIYSSKTSALVGMKKTLVFYGGRAPKGEKSNWVMHEYRLEGKLAYHYLSKNAKGEWVISRVFKKSSASDGVVKKWCTGGLNYGTETSCSSAVMGSLPPLLDSSLYANTTKQETSFPYDSNAVSKQHVPCFSTASITNYGFQPLLDIPPPEPLTSSFPSLNTLQENLQLHFFNNVAPPVHGGGESGNYVSSSSDEKPGPTELDCIWRF